MAGVVNEPYGRIYNFSAGPCALPLEVLEEAKEKMLNYNGCGMSVLEMSHRSVQFEDIRDETMGTLREVIGVPDSHSIIFMQGGATLQFAAVPMNLLGANAKKSDVVEFACTGSWSAAAMKEAHKYCSPVAVCDSKPKNYTYIPAPCDWNLVSDAKYLHYVSNETIYGVEFKYVPKVDVPLVCDMSSNFCSKPIDVAAHKLIFAGVQKNLGPAGAAVVIVDREYLARQGGSMPMTPVLMDYETNIKSGSMYNTPPCWTLYMTGLVAKFIKQKGGLAWWKNFSEQKANLLYNKIKSSDGYYSCPVAEDCRSNMNVVFRAAKANAELEKCFISEAKQRGLVNLGGHRSIGGCRASLYNAMSMKGVQALVDFMTEFQEKYPVA